MAEHHNLSPSLTPKVVAVGRNFTALEVAMLPTLGEISDMPAAIATALSQMHGHRATAVMLLEGSPPRLTLASSCHLTHQQIRALRLLREPNHPLLTRLSGDDEKATSPVTIRQGHLTWSLIPVFNRRVARPVLPLGAIFIEGQRPSLEDAGSVGERIGAALAFGLNYHQWKLDLNALAGDGRRAEHDTLQVLTEPQTFNERQKQHTAHLHRLLERGELLAIAHDDLIEGLSRLQTLIGPDGETLNDNWNALESALNHHAHEIEQLTRSLNDNVSILRARERNREPSKGHQASGDTLITST